MIFDILTEFFSQNAKAAYYALTSLAEKKLLDNWLNSAAAFTRNTAAGHSRAVPSHVASHPYFTKA